MCWRQAGGGHLISKVSSKEFKAALWVAPSFVSMFLRVSPTRPNTLDISTQLSRRLPAKTERRNDSPHSNSTQNSTGNPFDRDWSRVGSLFCDLYRNLVIFPSKSGAGGDSSGLHEF